jgi:hypothetical protein
MVGLTWDAIALFVLAFFTLTLLVEVLVLFIIDLLFILLLIFYISVGKGSATRGAEERSPRPGTSVGYAKQAIEWQRDTCGANAPRRLMASASPAGVCAAVRPHAIAFSRFRTASHHTNDERHDVGRVLRQLESYLLLFLLFAAGQGNELVLLILLSLAT